MSVVYDPTMVLAITIFIVLSLFDLWTWYLVFQGMTTLEHMDRESNSSRGLVTASNPKIKTKGRFCFSEKAKSTLREIFGHDSVLKMFLPDTSRLDESIFLYTDDEAISQDPGEGENHNLIRN